MIGEVLVFAIIFVPLAFLFAGFCIQKLLGPLSIVDDGWKKVREEGDFIFYSKKPWYRDKPFELYVLKKKGKSVIFKGIEEKESEKKCIK